MIRINLLGLPRAKKGKRGGAGATTMMPAMGGGEGGPGIALFLMVGLLFGALGGYYFYWKADQAGKVIAANMEKEVAEGRRLAEVKSKFDRRTAEAKAFEARVKVIDQLRENQTGPVTLMNAISTTVNKTDAVWLVSMTDAGGSVNIDGTALSTTAVANLMANLMKSGYFKAVEIKDATQDSNSKDIAQFNFTLNCEKALAPTASPAAVPSGTAAQPKKS